MKRKFEEALPQAGMTSTHQTLLLRALKHRDITDIKTDTQEGFRALVKWLEHTQVLHRNHAQPASLITIL